MTNSPVNIFYKGTGFDWLYLSPIPNPSAIHTTPSQCMQPIFLLYAESTPFPEDHQMHNQFLHLFDLFAVMKK